MGSWTWLLLGTALVGGWACAPPPGAVSLAVQESFDSDLLGPRLFEEVTASSGIDFTYRNGDDLRPPHRSILESLGGGVALLDYDGDGLLDVYIPGGGYFAGPESKEIRGHPGRLYRNLGNWKFRAAMPEVGLESLGGGQPWFYSHAAAVADYDRDGWPDLLVTGWGRIALFRNVSDGHGSRRFEDVSAKVGLDQGITWATSAAWADLDGDGWPDLYICQYVNWSFANHPTCYYDGKTPDVCPPKNFQGLPHKVFRNHAGGSFLDVSAEAGLHKGGGNTSKGLGVLVVDVNLDGQPDLYVANDTVDNFLYVNRSTPGKIRLLEEGVLAGVARDGAGTPNGSMGLDAGDPDGSGLPSLWVTNYQNELHALYRNLCNKDRSYFLFRTPAAGIAAIGQQYAGWGTGFIDIDHDGWEDLFIVNGHAIQYPIDTERCQKPVLLRNQSGVFQEMTKRGGAYFEQPHLARGLALGDLDNDGKVDAVVSHVNEPVAVLRNLVGAGNHWLGVQLIGAGHADIVGARVVVEAGGRKHTRFAKGGGSYASSPDRRLVFGLGKTDRIDKLSVVWPDGKPQAWTNVALDGYHILVQGTSETLHRQDE
ncbi:MAG: CRTAC1 family protein [Gemmataceae bacterium]|nr:CRTAC1 family protein [Gemmataceae bacterium]